MFILDILILKSDFNKLDLKEIFLEWGGEYFSQEPSQFISNNNLIFYKNDNISYYNYFIENINLNEYIALNLKSSLLLELIDEINNKNINFFRNPFIIYLSEIWDKISKIYVLILRDEEDIDKNYKIFEITELTKIIQECLNFKTPLGVVIEKNIN